MDKRARLEALRKRKRLAELRAKKAAMESETQQAVPEPQTATTVPEFKPEGSGFLGATMNTKADPRALYEGVVEAARSVPIAGPLAEKAAFALTGEDPEEFYARREAAQEKYPVATGVGQATGTMGGFALAPAALTAQLGVSAADMALRGVEGEDMAKNLALEGALGGAGKLVGKALKAGKKIPELAGKRAEAAAGLDLTKSLRDKIAKLESTGRIQPGEIGQTLLKQKIVTPGASAATIAERSRGLQKQAGKEIDALLAGKVSPTKIAQDALEGKIQTPALTEIAQKVNKKIQKQIDLLNSAGEKIDLAKLRQLKTEIGNEVGDFTSKASSKQAGVKITKAFKDSIEGMLAEADIERLRKLNKTFQAAKLAEDPSMSKSMLRISEASKQMGIYGAAAKKPVLPITVITKQIWNKYGDTLLAAGLNKTAGIGKHAAAFAEAAEKGPSAVSALHFTLMQDDPEYRKNNTKKEE